MSTQQRSRWWELTRSSLIWGYWPAGQDERYNMTFVRCQQLAGIFSLREEPVYSLMVGRVISHIPSYMQFLQWIQTLSQHGRLTFDVDVE